MSKRSFHPRRPKKRSAAEEAYQAQLVSVATEIVLSAAVELAAARLGLDEAGAAAFRADVVTLFQYRAAQIETAARAADAERVRELMSATSNGGPQDGPTGAN